MFIDDNCFSQVSDVAPGPLVKEAVCSLLVTFNDK